MYTIYSLYMYFALFPKSPENVVMYSEWVKRNHCTEENVEQPDTQ